MIRLSKRLEALTRLCLPGGCGADVGCDHGYLSIRLIRDGIFERMLAMDLREGPLSAAKEHVAEEGLDGCITCRISDGIRELQPGEAEAMICAGMGGMLMQRILMQDIDKVRGMRQLILQPQSDVGDFRRWLRKNSFSVEAEDMICEDGKYYPMMRVVPQGTPVQTTVPDVLADAFGGLLLTQRHPVLYEHLLQRKGFVEEALKQLKRAQQQGSDARREQRIAELLQEAQLIQEAISYYS